MDLLSSLIYIALTIFLVTYLLLKKSYSHFEDRGIPHIKPTSWLLGNMKNVGKTIHMMELVKKIYEEGTRRGDVIAGLYSSFEPTLIITDLDLIKQITVKDFNNFVDRGTFINEENEPLTGHLFNLGGDKWRFLRNKLSPVFTSGKIKSMYSTISDKGDNFVNAITGASSSGSIDVKEIASRFTTDVISSCAFGLEANTLNDEHPELIQIFKKVFQFEGLAGLRLFFVFTFPKLSKVLNLRQFDKTVEDFFFDIIQSSIVHRENNKVVRNDFAQMLVQLKTKGSIDGEVSSETRKLTMNECVAQGFVFFFAGADTSSTAIAWAITELSLNSASQEKLREEILEKTESSDGEITYDNLHEMTYLNQVLNETLRKHSPAPILMRQALNEYKIPGSKHVIRKGENVWIPNDAIHYDERYWKNPEQFNPDRFTVEEIAKRPNFSFLPFGEGPRNCIGMRFAQVNVKFAIATIIKNFKVTLDETKIHLPLKLDCKEPAFVPLGGFWANFEKI